MPHPIQSRLAALRRRARGLVLVYAIGRLAASLAAAVLVLVLADWLIRFDDRGLRTMASLAVLAVAVWAVVRYLVPAVAAPLGSLSLARAVQRAFPQLQDRLASTVEFLDQPENDPLAGSPALRRAVIAQTNALVDQLDLHQALHARPAWRAAAAALAVCGLALLIALANPTLAAIGLRRLANPFGDAQWPKVNHLAFKDPPSRIALGQPFEVELVDTTGARLPDDVFIQFRYEGQQDPDASPERMKLVGKQMVARKEQVTRPFKYRAYGGDDDSMDWVSLEVVEPPAVERLAVKLHYPAYTGWPPEPSEHHIRALVGTRVQLAGRATKPLASATVHRDQAQPIPVAIGPDGYQFRLPVIADGGMIVEKSGAWWFQLVDRDRFPGGQQIRYELRAVEDEPPSVSIDQPSANVFLTPDAVVPLHVAVKDDLAIHKVALHYTRSDRSQEGETVFSLFEGKAAVDPRPAGDARLTQGDNQAIVRPWNLAELGLAPGTELTIHATADDYRPQSGASHSRRLSIITPEELTDRLAERQEFILNELARVLKLQRDARQQVSGLQIQLDQVGRLEKPDVDQLQTAEMTQRQVDRGLTSPTEGVASQIQGLLADLANNKVDSPDIQRHMQSLAAEIDRLAAEQLPRIARHLTASIKQAQSAATQQAGDDPAVPPGSADDQPPPSPAGPSAELASAGKQQDQVIQSLEGLLGELSRWDNYRRFHRDIGQLRRDQQQLARDTADVARQTLTQDLKDLDPRQQADLKKLSARQLELARRFDRIQDGMRQTAAELESTDPVAADTLGDALEQASQTALGGAIREAGRQLDANQVAQAAAGQEQVDQQLAELLDILSNRREHELARLVKKLAEAERELDALRSQQAGLTKRLKSAADKPDDPQRRRELERLTRQQEQARQEAQRVARALKRLEADRAGRSAGRAAESMERSGQQAQQGDASAAAEQSQAAEQDLQEAQRQLAQQRRQAQLDLAAEQIARLEDGLSAIRQRQARLLEETQHYHALRQSQGDLSRAQKISVGGLAREQSDLQGQTAALAEKLVAAEVFHLGLKGAARDMAQAGSLLDQLQLGDPSQQALQRALARLDQMLEALKPDPAAAGQQAANAQEPQQGGGSPASGQSADGIRFLSELKLLKLMQQDINQRTQSLQLARQAGPPTDDQRQQYVDLSQEQGQVADLLLNLAEPADSDTLDNLDDLPEIEPSDSDPLDNLDDLPEPDPADSDPLDSLDDPETDPSSTDSAS